MKTLKQYTADALAIKKNLDLGDDTVGNVVYRLIHGDSRDVYDQLMKQSGAKGHDEIMAAHHQAAEARQQAIVGVYGQEVYDKMMRTGICPTEF